MKCWEVAVDFKASPNNPEVIKFVSTENISFKNDDVETKLFVGKAYSITQVFTLKLHGINKRN